MDINAILHTISLVLAPVVMVSCCTIFLNGQLQRYDAISSRIRAMNQERFAILCGTGSTITSALATLDGFSELRVSEIEAQLPHLLKRHKMILHATLIIGLAILTFVVGMVILALGLILNSNPIALTALISFLLGMTIVFLGGTMIILELYQSHNSVQYEVMHALSMGEKSISLTAPHRTLKVPFSLHYEMGKH